MKDKVVLHKLLGQGRVLSLKNDLLTVEFSEKEMTFIFPDCFQSVLSTEDKELSAFVKMAINNRALEKKLVEKKGLKKRVYQTRKEIPRWSMGTKSTSTVKSASSENTRVVNNYNSIKENNITREKSSHLYESNTIREKSPYLHETKTEKKIPQTSKQVDTKKKVNNFTKYSNKLVRYKGINCFLYIGSVVDDVVVLNSIELTNNKTLCQYIYKNDLIFCCENNEIKGIGIVDKASLSEDETYKYNLQLIPLIDVVKMNNQYDDKITHLKLTEYKGVLYDIRKVCPYISSIEGIRELL